MSDEWRWWLGNRDYFLRDRTEQLADELSRASSETSRISSQLRHVQGTLEQRVNRLATAFDAFIELSDLRTDLNAFTDAAAARHRVRRIVVGGIEGDSALADDLEDVDGYWLVPAARAFAALGRGDESAAAVPLAEATRLDATRTRLFLLTALGVAKAPALALPWLGEALGELTPGPVTHAQRALWLAAAEGRFGPEGRALLTERLARAVGALPADQVEVETKAWLDTIRHLPSPRTSRLPDQFARDARYGTALSAAAVLGALRLHCEQTLMPSTGVTEDAAVQRAPQRQLPPAVLRQSTDAPPAGTDPAPGQDDDPLRDIVVTLVDEGSPDEAPVLRRVAELRRVISSNGQAPSEETRPGWRDEAGDLVTFVRQDAFDRDAGVAMAAGVALRACAPLADAVAERLAADTVIAVPDESTVTIEGVAVRVTAEGPRSADVRALDEAIAERAPGATPERLGYGIAAVGVLLFVAGLATEVGLVVLGVLAVVAGGGYGIYATRTRLAARAESRVTQDLAHGRADTAAKAVGELAGVMRDGTANVADDKTAVHALLS
ncbi:MAG: hypothetical protein GEV10_06170 [Streptosporangiales bacterium]|nr:hypothetical protein [Streptosporangiales bacterium]